MAKKTNTTSFVGTVQPNLSGYWVPGSGDEFQKNLDKYFVGFPYRAPYMHGDGSLVDLANITRGVRDGWPSLYDRNAYGDNSPFRIYRDENGEFYVRSGYDSNVNMSGLTLVPYSEFRKALPRRDYIGGENYRIKAMSRIPGFSEFIYERAKAYGIDPNLLYHRISKEGFVDSVVQRYNSLDAVQQDEGFWSGLWDLPYSGFEYFGLDDAGSNLKSGKYELLDPSAEWEELSGVNENNRIVTSVLAKNLRSAIEIKAAEMAYRQGEVQRRYKPSEDSLGMWTNAAYNMGLSHEKLNDTDYVTRNYSYPNYYKQFGLKTGIAKKYGGLVEKYGKDKLRSVVVKRFDMGGDTPESIVRNGWYFSPEEFSDDNANVFRFVGTPADSLRWSKEYEEINNKALGGPINSFWPGGDKRNKQNDALAKAIVDEVDRNEAARELVEGQMIGEAPLAEEHPLGSLLLLRGFGPLGRGVASEASTYGGVYANAAKRFFRDIPAFELVDRLPGLLGGKRMTELGGDATQWVADNTFNRSGNQTASALSRLPGEFAFSIVPGLGGDMLMNVGSRLGERAISGIGNALRRIPRRSPATVPATDVGMQIAREVESGALSEEQGEMVLALRDAFDRGGIPVEVLPNGNDFAINVNGGSALTASQYSKVSSQLKNVKPKLKKGERVLVNTGDYYYLCEGVGNNDFNVVNSVQIEKVDGLSERQIRTGLEKRTINREPSSGITERDNVSDGGKGRLASSVSNDGGAQRGQRFYAGKNQVSDSNEIAETAKTINKAIRSKEGTILGFNKDGKIYLTPEGLNPETPIHEYSEIWWEALKRNNAKGFESAKNALRSDLGELIQAVKSDPAYEGILDASDEDAVLKEVFGRYSGQRGAERLSEMAKTGAKGRDLADKISEFLSKAWDWIAKNVFNVTEFRGAGEVADMALKDLMEGAKLGEIKSDIGFNSGLSKKVKRAVELYKEGKERKAYPDFLHSDEFRQYQRDLEVKYTKHEPLITSDAEADRLADRIASNTTAPSSAALDYYFNPNTTAEVDALMESFPEYAEFLVQNHMEPLSQETIDAFAKRQASAFRGISIKDATNMPDINTSLLEYNPNRTGGDRLGSRGGVYTSNSYSIADRFMHPTAGKSDGVIGTVGFPIKYDKNLPIAEQLKQIRSGFFQYDAIQRALKGYQVTRRQISDAAKKTGFFAGESVYTNKNGIKEPAVERVSLIQEPLSLQSHESYKGLKDEHGRWGIGGVEQSSRDSEVFIPFTPSHVDKGRMKELIKAISRETISDSDNEHIRELLDHYLALKKQAEMLKRKSFAYKLGQSAEDISDGLPLGVAVGTISGGIYGIARYNKQRVDFDGDGTIRTQLLHDFYGDAYPPTNEDGSINVEAILDMESNKEFKRAYDRLFEEWRKNRKQKADGGNLNRFNAGGMIQKYGADAVREALNKMRD